MVTDAAQCAGGWQSPEADTGRSEDGPWLPRGELRQAAQEYEAGRDQTPRTMALADRGGDRRGKRRGRATDQGR